MAEKSNKATQPKLSTVKVRMGKPGITRQQQKEAQKIVQQIITLARNYSAKNIDDVKLAERQAENPVLPNRIKMYDLYFDLAKDLHLVMIMRKLETIATGSKFHIIDDATGDVDIDATKLFKAEWFEDFVHLVTETPFWGHTLLELTEADPRTNKIAFELIPRKNVVPEKGAWCEMQMDMNYHYYRDTPAMDWLIEIGKPKDLGWLIKLAYAILYKKVAWYCWSEFGERFGNPIAVASTNTRDTDAVNKLEGFLQNLSSKAYAITDNNEKLELVESTKTDSYSVYDKNIERANGEMSKAILLEIMSSDVGDNGSRSLGEVQKEAGAPALKAWLRKVEYVTNNKLMPVLVKHGFKLKGKSLKYIEEKKVDKDTWAQDVWGFANFEIDIKYWAEKYGWPITAVKAKPLPDNQPEGTDPNQLKKLLKKLSSVELHAAIHKLYKDDHQHT